MTLHAPLGRLLSDPVLETLDQSLRTHGITTWWIDPKYLPDAVVLAEIPEELAVDAEEADDDVSA